MNEIRGGQRPLDADDLLHVKAAECWLALGEVTEANRELENVRPGSRRHPEVKKVGEQIRAASRVQSSEFNV